MCKEFKREYGGNSNIGEVFAHANSENNIWPPEAICKVLDQYKNEQIEKGFFYGIINNRGMTTRDPFEGGQQERDLAKHYLNLASKIEKEYPYTARILNDIALHYKTKANREDEEAKKEELEY